MKQSVVQLPSYVGFNPIFEFNLSNQLAEVLCGTQQCNIFLLARRWPWTIFAVPWPFQGTPGPK